MSVIKTEVTSCRDCYKCVRHCPVKAIRVSMGHAEIVDERCIKDGRCLNICPQGAKVVRKDVEKAITLLKNKEKVVVSLAPSFVAAFPEVSPGQLVSGLKRLGFQEIRETAEGAEWVALEHALLVQEKKGPFISSSCPAINALIYTYYPQYIGYLAPVVSPMIAHARILRKEHSSQEIGVVFIGPCVAKKAEAEEEEVLGEVDVVLTFQELREWLQREKIDLASLPEESFSQSRISWARAFPVEGGLLKSASLETDLLSVEKLVITGIDRAKRFLEEFEKESPGLKLVEMMSCEGGCIDGPMLESGLSLVERRRRVIDFAEQKLVHIESSNQQDPQSLPSLRRTFKERAIPRPVPPEEEIKKILALTGKFTPRDELNCGACGYNTCREKAIAVYQGMAEAEMCIPFMRARAESFSSFLMSVTPNGIVLLDDNLRIVEVNPAFRRMFHLEGKLVVGKRIDALMDPSIFAEVLRTHRAVIKEFHFPQYDDLYARVSVFYLEKPKLLMSVIVDLSREKEQEKKLEEIREKTIERAQQVINNQMRVAQEIASLLGETTAETKVLLNALIKILKGESAE
ncbi:MAG: hypothetical protein PWP60_576 [Candidatus Atribacteria bacterium]|uniref:[Fe-Fe] hydrogenase large subunit C-terminal domain-containing protein n=1 Tax=Atrimonas thermophila TaxID=3064161 RepID=UPI0024AA5E30|nr:hypothetical protein [Candidatus Atribacteria bacterium]